MKKESGGHSIFFGKNIELIFSVGRSEWSCDPERMVRGRLAVVLILFVPFVRTFCDGQSTQTH
jgi:hypothetical protein